MDLHSLYFDRDGNAINQLEWIMLREDKDYWRVAETTIGELWVSTVWLGLNHQFGDGPPIIFETMVFEQGDYEGPEVDDLFRRYSTLEEARNGHNATVIELRYADIVANERKRR